MQKLSPKQIREDLSSLQDCLVMATPVLLSDPGQLPTQFHARLLSISSTQAAEMVRTVNRYRRSWLRMMFPTLNAPGSALKITFRHKDDVMAVAISADGTRAASGSLDGLVCVWDLKKASAIMELNADLGRPAMAFSAQGTRLANIDEESNKVVVYDVDRAAVVLSFPGEAFRLALVENGQHLLWVSSDGLYSRYVEAGAKEPVLRQPGIFSFSVSEDGCCIAYGQTKKSYRDDFEEVIGRGSTRCVLGLLDRTGGSSSILAEESSLSSVAGNENGSIVLAGYEDGSIHAFSARSKRRVAGLRGHTEEITSLAISADGLRAVSISRDATLRIWDLGTWTEQALLHLPAIGQAVDLTPDGKIAITGCTDGTVQVWDVNVAVAAAGSTHGQENRVSSVRFGRRGSKAGVHWQGDTISWIDLAREPEPTEESPLQGKLLDYDGKRALIAYRGTIGVVDMDPAPHIIRSFKEPRHLSGAAVASNGRVVAVNGEPAIHIWEPSGSHRSISMVSQEQQERYKNQADPKLGPLNVVTGAVRVSPNGKLVMTQLGLNLPDLWNIELGVKLRTFGFDNSNWMFNTWDTDAGFQKLVLVGTRQGDASCALRVFDIASGDLIASHSFNGDPQGISVSGDGTLAAVMLQAGGLTVIQLGSGEMLGSFTGDSPFEEVAVNPNGSLILAIEATGRMHRMTVDGWEWTK